MALILLGEEEMMKLSFRSPYGTIVDHQVKSGCLIYLKEEARYVWWRKATLIENRVKQTPNHSPILLTIRKTLDQACSCKYSAYCDSQLSVIDGNRTKVENEYVFQVYDAIAPHFRFVFSKVM